MKEVSLILKNNTISATVSGIYCEDSYGVKVSGNAITGTGDTGKGLDLRDVDGEATGNDISGFQYGVYLRTPFFTPEVTGNKIYDNGREPDGYGLYCAGPEHIDASDNTWCDPEEPFDASGPDPYGNCNSVGGYGACQRL